MKWLKILMKSILGLSIGLYVLSPECFAELKFNTQDFAPFTYMENNSVKGPGVDVIKAVCNEMNAICSFHLLPWRRAQKEVEIGKAHAIFLIGWNKKRADWLYFSHPILKTEYGFFVKKNNPLNYKKMEDVKGFTVGVYGPSNTSRSLEKIKEKMSDLNIDMKAKDETGFKKLAVNRVDAVYSNRDVGYNIMERLVLDNIRYAGAHEQLKYYIGFSKRYTDKQTVERFNAAFKKLHDQGVIQQILKGYNLESSELE